MAAITPRFTEGRRTLPVTAVVAGGQLVDADTTVTTSLNATPSAAGSKICLGVALLDAAPAGTDAATDAAARPPVTVVAKRCIVPVTYAAAATSGALLKTAAAGQVTPWVDGTDDPALIVGRCVDGGGSVAANAVALAEIF